MSIKSQIVKEFFRESYAPLWKEVRVGKDCDSMCRAKWERLKKEDTEYRKGLDESGRQDTRRGFKYVGFQDSENFEDYHKRLRETAKGKWSDDCTAFGVQRKPNEEWRIDSLYSDGSGGKRPEDVALCAHKFSKFYKIDWEKMHIEMHHSIVTGIREIFTKRKSHGGDTATEFRADKTYTVSYLQPLGDVINRFLDENKEYRIEMIRYNGANWMDQETSNEPSALVVFAGSYHRVSK